MRGAFPIGLLVVSCSSTPGVLSVTDSVVFDGTSAECPETKRVQLANSGGAPLMLTVTKVSGDAVRALPSLAQPSPVFTLEGLPTSLAPGSSVEVPVRFTPDNARTSFSATVDLRAGAQSATLVLEGRRRIDDWELPGAFDLGAVALGLGETIPFELRPSAARESFSNPFLTGVGFSREVRGLVFSPPTLGRFEGGLRLDYRFAPECSAISFDSLLIGDAVPTTLTFTGIADFGLVPPGLSKTFDVVFENLAFKPVTVSYLTARGPFTVEPLEGGRLVVPGGTRDVVTKALVPGKAVVRLRFSPSDLGPRSGVLDFATNNTLLANPKVLLRGTGGGP